jgi:hypothetical protein
MRTLSPEREKGSAEVMERPALRRLLFGLRSVCTCIAAAVEGVGVVTFSASPRWQWATAEGSVKRCVLPLACRARLC